MPKIRVFGARAHAVPIGNGRREQKADQASGQLGGAAALEPNAAPRYPASVNAAASARVRPSARVRRILARGRPTVSALLMTTAVAWSIGVRVPEGEADLSPPALSVSQDEAAKQRGP